MRRGEAAAGLSPTTITRLRAPWETAYTAFRPRALRARDDVSIWGDGVHVTIRRDDARRCTLVVRGVRADGVKDVRAMEDGSRERPERWRTRWRDLTRRGVTASVVAGGDGALGVGNAVGEVWPETREPHGWGHRFANGLDTWPKRRQPNAPRALHEIMQAARRGDADVAITACTAEDQAQDPKAVASLDRDQEQRLTCVDVPAEVWLHWRTTTPVEPPCRTVRGRQRVTKGAGSRMKGLGRAEARGRQLNAPHLLPLVQTTVTCVEGIQPRTNRREGNGGRLSRPIRPQHLTIPLTGDGYGTPGDRKRLLVATSRRPLRLSPSSWPQWSTVS